MDGLSGAASIIAVVTIAVKLGDCIYKFSKLLKSIQDAPRELQLLINDLDRLRQILAEVAQVADMQKDLGFAPAPSMTLLAAIKECQLRFESLEGYASKLTSRIEDKGVRRALIPLKIPVQKDTLRKLHGEMRQSIDHLGTLLILNSTKIQLAHLGQAQKLLTPTLAPKISTDSLHNSPVSPMKGAYAPLVSKQSTVAASSYAWHRSPRTISYGTFLQVLGYCVTYRQFHFSERSELRPKKIKSMKGYDWSIVIFFWFMSRYLEFQSRVYYGQVERRWRICPVDPRRQSPAWALCASGDTQGILNLFSKGLSPYIKDGQGRSLLNAASIGGHTELCRVLQQHGVSLCAYYEDYGFIQHNRFPLLDISQFGNSLESSWDIIQILVSHEEEFEDAFLANIDGYIIFAGNQGFIRWDNWTRYALIPGPSLSEAILFDSIRQLSDGYLNEEDSNTLRATLKFLLISLGQTRFSISREEYMSLLNALFDLNQFMQRNIWDLEDSLESLGQEFCSILEHCGIDAQKFIDRMTSMKGEDDVYLESIDHGTRGIGRRRLMRGKTAPLSLRWEWDPPPKENPYQVLEEFGRLCAGTSHLIYDWEFEDAQMPGWPFNNTPRNPDCPTPEYLLGEKRKAKKSRRKDRVNQSLREIPGAFPD